MFLVPSVYCCTTDFLTMLLTVYDSKSFFFHLLEEKLKWKEKVLLPTKVVGKANCGTRISKTAEFISSAKPSRGWKKPLSERKKYPSH